MSDQRARITKVKNKAPAEIQITAEQLLREAKERSDASQPPIRQRVTDAEEAGEVKYHKRKNFEDAIRRNKTSIGTWLKYAAWEEHIREFARARSIYERTLEIDPRNITVWLKYAEMEMKQKNINLARNIWNRAITILPRVDQFWYKYAYMEELIGNVSGARQIYERWMNWDPIEQVWGSYIKLEKRYKEFDRVRELFERFVRIHPIAKNWCKYAKFEEQEVHSTERARNVFEQAVTELEPDERSPKLYSTFAKFEIRHGEIERARVIFKYAMDTLPIELREFIGKQSIAFEKQYGKKDEMEILILNKRRNQYEEKLKTSPRSYDTWFDFIRMEESGIELEGEGGDITPSNEHLERVRKIYERAIHQVPPVKEKRFWKRYIYLWIYYALFEETVSKDVERAKVIYKNCLAVIPHKEFTFAKIWDLYAKFLIRRLELTSARKTLGSALGQYPKPKLFKNYIELELLLREFDRCRTLYEKYLMYQPENATTWIKYAELEKLLGDEERARGIYELGVSQAILNLPELLWKSFIDFEYESENWDKTRSLYERLLMRSEHVQVWTSYGQMEATLDMNKCRAIFERGHDNLRDSGASIEDRVRLLESWLACERGHFSTKLAEKEESSTNEERDDEQSEKSTSMNEDEDEEKKKWIEAVLKRFPKQLPRKKKDPISNLVEEVMEWVFPEDLPSQPHNKLLAMAYAWKQQASSSSSSSSSGVPSNDLNEPIDNSKGDADNDHFHVGKRLKTERNVDGSISDSSNTSTSLSSDTDSSRTDSSRTDSSGSDSSDSEPDV